MNLSYSGSYAPRPGRHIVAFENWSPDQLKWFVRQNPVKESPVQWVTLDQVTDEGILEIGALPGEEYRSQKGIHCFLQAFSRVTPTNAQHDPIGARIPNTAGNLHTYPRSS